MRADLQQCAHLCCSESGVCCGCCKKYDLLIASARDTVKDQIEHERRLEVVDARTLDFTLN